MTNVEALKALYVALGGEESDVADCTTNTDVLNVISAKYQGSSDALTNVEALQNIIEVAGNIGGGGDFSTAKVTFKSETGIAEELIVATAYENDPSYDAGTGTSVMTDVSSGYEITFNAVLYKGVAYAYPKNDVTNVIVTGAITYSDGNITIRGDGTITIS